MPTSPSTSRPSRFSSSTSNSNSQWLTDPNQLQRGLDLLQGTLELSGLVDHEPLALPPAPLFDDPFDSIGFDDLYAQPAETSKRGAGRKEGGDLGAPSEGLRIGIEDEDEALFGGTAIEARDASPTAKAPTRRSTRVTRSTATKPTRPARPDASEVDQEQQMRSLLAMRAKLVEAQQANSDLQCTLQSFIRAIRVAKSENSELAENVDTALSMRREDLEMVVACPHDSALVLPLFKGMVDSNPLLRKQHQELLELRELVSFQPWSAWEVTRLHASVLAACKRLHTLRLVKAGKVSDLDELPPDEELIKLSYEGTGSADDEGADQELSRLDWNIVAESVQSHPAEDCRTRWLMMERPGLSASSTPWSEEEKAALLELLATRMESGPRGAELGWDGLAKELGTNRSGAECCFFFVRSDANPSLAPAEYDEAEDRTLCRLTAVWGPFWGVISERLGKLRTLEAVAAHHKTTLKDGPTVSAAWDADSDATLFRIVGREIERAGIKLPPDGRDLEGMDRCAYVKAVHSIDWSKLVKRLPGKDRIDIAMRWQAVGPDVRHMKVNADATTLCDEAKGTYVTCPTPIKLNRQINVRSPQCVRFKLEQVRVETLLWNSDIDDFMIYCAKELPLAPFWLVAHALHARGVIHFRNRFMVLVAQGRLQGPTPSLAAAHRPLVEQMREALKRHEEGEETHTPQGGTDEGPKPRARKRRATERTEGGVETPQTSKRTRAAKKSLAPAPMDTAEGSGDAEMQADAELVDARENGEAVAPDVGAGAAHLGIALKAPSAGVAPRPGGVTSKPANTAVPKPPVRRVAAAPPATATPASASVAAARVPSEGSSGIAPRIPIGIAQRSAPSAGASVALASPANATLASPGPAASSSQQQTGEARRYPRIRRSYSKAGNAKPISHKCALASCDRLFKKLGTAKRHVVVAHPEFVPPAPVGDESEEERWRLALELSEEEKGRLNEGVNLYDPYGRGNRGARKAAGDGTGEGAEGGEGGESQAGAREEEGEE